MTLGPDRASPRQRLELGRLLIGSLAEFGIKAYGVAAATSVALSNAETVGGKTQDAVGAVSNLADRFRAAQYVFEHRVEIQTALDYVHEHTPPQAELEDSIDRSTDTLDGIQTTFGEVDGAMDAFTDFPPSPLEAFGPYPRRMGGAALLGIHP